MSFFSKKLLKWLVVLVIILAVLSTGINSDIFYGASIGKNTVAKIGKQEITQEEFIREYKNQAYNIQSQFNFGLTEEQLRSLGLGKMVLHHLVQQKTAQEVLRKMGFKIQEESAIDLIKKEQYFKTNKDFDRKKFEAFLQNSGLTEDQYIKEVVSIFGLGVFYSLFSESGINYTKVAKMLYEYDYQLRTVGISTATRDEIKYIPQPTSKELLEFYEKNKEYFYTPEYRSGEIFKISFDTVVQDLIAVNDQDLEKNFEELDYNKLFDIEYITFSSVEEAQRARELMMKNPAEEEYKEQIKSLNGLTKLEYLDWASDDDLDSQDARWGLLLRSDGIYLIRLIKTYEITDENLLLDLKQKLKSKMQSDKFLKLIEKIEDKIADGANYQDLSKEYGGNYLNFDFVTQDGKSQGNQSYHLKPKELRIAFSLQKGRSSECFYVKDGSNKDDAKSGYYANIKIKEIQNPVQQEFGAAKVDVERVLKKRITDEMLIKIAQEKSDNDKFSAKMELYREDFINRERNKVYEPLPDDFLDQVFKLKVGDSTKPFWYEDRFICAKLLSKQKPKENDLIVAGIESRLKNQFVQSLIADLAQYYGKEFNVKVNPELIKEFL